MAPRPCGLAGRGLFGVDLEMLKEEEGRDERRPAAQVERTAVRRSRSG